VPFEKDPHVPSGLPKLANLIEEIGLPWHESSIFFFSSALTHAAPIAVVWKLTEEGSPPNSSNKTKVLSPSLLRKDLGT
jgi:hypothetical protein